MRVLPLTLAIATFFATLWLVPSSWCRRGAAEWYSGERTTQEQLAQTVAQQIDRGLTRADFKTKSELFDGEWLFGTNLMAGIGLCQLVQAHPEALEKWRPAIENCIRQLLSEPVRAFDQKSWNRDALASLAANDGHAAYLGYFNFLLSLYRQIAPQNEFTALNDAITEALVRRTLASRNGLIATYPDEWYPVDNTSGLASIALHSKVTGTDRSEFLRHQVGLFRSRFVDEKTGLLIQAVNADGSPRDYPRGSGSALGIFFLTRFDPQLARELFAGIQHQLVGHVFNFGAVREYPRGTSGMGDIDSGPVLFGWSFSATGFSIAGARAFRNEALYSDLYASAILAGAPDRHPGQIDFLTAGPLGNAILLAVLTTPFSPQ